MQTLEWKGEIMISKETVKMANEEEDYELPTSTIDVVFLLLIFFMCSMQFRTVEQKLDAQLPGEGPVGPPIEIDPPTELRVKVFWRNSQGQVIHSQSKSYPTNWNGMRAVNSTEGAKVAIQINQKSVKNIPELAEKLAALNAATPMPVVIDARLAVPFKYVVGVLDACSRASIKEVKFQAPPQGEEGAGGDWYWM